MAKIKGSSLLETTLALSMLSIVFTSFWFCIGQLASNSKLPTHWKAELVIDQISKETKAKNEFFDTRFEQNGFYILRKIKETPYGRNLFSLQLEAFNSHDKLITSKREIIYVE